ncbi:glycosyltransferase family 2 protein [Salegentibacter sp. JZCK2]|uniref:glycosyltransferase n=1 Tax=Salegentibacter tibetensis TaxID=2873600 RepID=UPI001CCBD7FA|nr:glycosyltransferase [Salegentibacter tibetensis]MBZ9729743.1 glycosyltransferase family 2 protein [Salegentibacter tibetensis]
MHKGVSIIICTYNGKPTLTKTLEHLTHQKFQCAVEIVLVDNASNDGTKTFADEWWNLHGTEKLGYRSYIQPIPGKSYAQELGYNKASYEYLLICDDDNWLSPHYVQTAFEIMNSYAEIGALGGWCEAKFEGKKPKWFDGYKKYFAVGKQSDISGDITKKKGCLYGAGMVIRKSHWVYLKELGFKPLLTCRKGDSLSSGGDTEYCYALRLLGYKIWYDDRLHFFHYMLARRVNLDYVSKVRKAISFSNFVCEAYLDELAGKENSVNTLNKKIKKELKNDVFRKTKNIIIGDFEAKEKSKEFFRRFYNLKFRQVEYIENRGSIKEWL